MPSTRAQARTPSYSPFTPTPEDTRNDPAAHACIGPSSTETEMNSLNSTPSPTPAAEDNDANMASLPASPPTLITIKATRLPGEESSQTLQTSDRAAEFAEETTRARHNVRESAENSNDNEDKKPCPAQESGNESHSHEHAATSNGVGQALQKSPHTETAGEQTTIEPTAEREATPVRSQALWIDEAVSRMTHKKTASSRQNMLIVLDASDLAQSCLINSKVFTKTAFADLCTRSIQASQNFQHKNGLKALLVLECTDTMPKLKVAPLDYDLEMEVQTKRESTSGEDVKPPVPDPQSTGAAGWARQYRSLFLMLEGKRHHGLPDDAESALPQIEKILRISREYKAVHRVSAAFDKVLVNYVQNCTLWPAIERAPQQWLHVGVELQSPLVFDEAFKHLVGRSANYQDAIEFPTLASDIQERVWKSSRELYYKRMHAEKALVFLTLKEETSGTSQHVSQRIRPIAYSAVNIFRDWITAHVGALEVFDKHNQGSDDMPELKDICKHENGCNTLAGFHRVVATGGNAYLNADVICKSWNKEFFGKVDSDVVKESIESLKVQASETVAELVASTLKLDSKDELPYLTCVKVEPEDVPWSSEQDIDSDEEMEED